MIPLLKLAWTYRKWIGIALAAVSLVIAFLAYRHSLIAMGHREGAAEIQVQWDNEKAKSKDQRIQWYEDQVAKANADKAKSEADTAALAKRLADGQVSISRLQDALGRARMTTSEPVPGKCPVVRLSSAFRVCVQAASNGAASQIADCEAFGVSKPVAPATGNPAP